MTEPRSRRMPHPGTIRPLEPGDREAVREICRKTAFRNMGSDRFFEDREVHADYWTRYYTDFRPWESWVIEQEGEVIGYFFGCSDQANYVRTMSLHILPSCLLRVLWRWATGKYKRAETRRYVRHMLLKGPKEAPKIDYARYPAHYHCNILRKGYGQGHYTRMTLMFLDLLEAKGITRLHGHITEPVDSGIWHSFARRYDAASADVTDEVPTTLFADVICEDRPMVNRVWGITVANYRGWIEWLRDRYNL